MIHRIIIVGRNADVPRNCFSGHHHLSAFASDGKPGAGEQALRGRVEPVHGARPHSIAARAFAAVLAFATGFGLMWSLT